MTSSSFRKSGARERGVVLFVALIVLIVMSLAGLALMRQTGTGTSIAGNIAFKEGATSVADVGVEKALVFLGPKKSGTALWADDPTEGYFATWDPSFNPATHDWNLATVKKLPVADPSFLDSKNQTSYVIHRLCEQPGAPGSVAGQRCSEAVVPTAGSKGGVSAATPDIQPDPQPFYRVTARVAGPRNTVSIVQVIVTF